MSAEGWIGNWSPGIGDPTVGGWLAVASYLLGAALCLAARQRLLRGHGLALPGEAWSYGFLAITLVCLSLNKQLDLQSALTEIGRILSYQQGWYDNRHQVQLAFMTLLGLLGVAILLTVMVRTWRWPCPTRLAWAAWLGLGVFVLLRAASFHQMDRFIGMRLGGITWNHWLELGSLWVLAAAVAWRLRYDAKVR